MRQVARRLLDGRLELVEAPEPGIEPGTVLVRTEASVISSGTERATLEVARKGLIAKARARPDQARQVIERARREGIRSTASLVRARLDELGPLGYSSAGVVVEAGAGVHGLMPGDRVAAAGAGVANHAELNMVPSLLCAGVPDGVSFEQAAFSTLGAIALHGFRRSGADLGSTIAVIGLGLIGQLAVRIARAAGCRVIGIDLEQEPVELASAAGAESIARPNLGDGERWSGAADAVLICASSRSDDPIELAATLCRDRAPIVVVGDVAMDLPRAPFYEKELDLRLSRSYGPGRYDPEYELHGRDYPAGYVRWTEQRNMQAFLQLMAENKVDPSPLISHRFDFSDAEEAFDALDRKNAIAIVLSYGGQASDSSDGAAGLASASTHGEPTDKRKRKRVERPGFGLIGAGSFATATIVPGLRQAGLRPSAVASARGLSAVDTQRRFDFTAVAQDPDELISRDDVALVVIATRHDSHAELAARSLAAGKPTYVEKPLSLDWEGLRLVREAQMRTGAPLVVGFNRRHSPLAAELRALSHPRLMTYRVNAGALAGTHWLNDPKRGGGRLKGEGCHFIDFLCDQAGADPETVMAQGFPSRAELPLAATDNFTVQIVFADDSIGNLTYASDAPTTLGKERFETSGPNCFGVIDDFRRGIVSDQGRRTKIGRRRQEKGFAEQFWWLAAIVRDEVKPPSPDSFYVSTIATLAAARSIETGQPEPVVTKSMHSVSG